MAHTPAKRSKALDVVLRTSRRSEAAMVAMCDIDPFLSPLVRIGARTGSLNEGVALASPFGDFFVPR
jgi:hypothetical protein